MLDEIPGLEWKQRLAQELLDIEVSGDARAQFQKLYMSLENETALFEAIQEFLGVRRNI
jgi:hypothetical protein